MLFGRDAIQVVTTLVYAAVLAVIAFKLYRNRRSWLAFIPLVINVALTIAFYYIVFNSPVQDIPSLGDLSAMLRLETGLTILIYAWYMPMNRRGV